MQQQQLLQQLQQQLQRLPKNQLSPQSSNCWRSLSLIVFL